MKTIRNIFRDSKRSRRGTPSASGTKTDSVVQDVTVMDTNAIDEAMLRLRSLIRKPQPLLSSEMKEIKDIVTLLTESGNERNVYTHKLHENDTNLLCEAIIYTKFNVVKMLVENGVNVNAGSCEGVVGYDLPLHMAIACRKIQFVSYLLVQNADLYKQCILTLNPKGTHIQELFPPMDAFQIVFLSNDLPLMKELLNSSQYQTNPSKYLIHQACKAGSSDCVNFLLPLYPWQLLEKDINGDVPWRLAFWKDPKLACSVAESTGRNVVHKDLLWGVTGLSGFDMFFKVCSEPPYKLTEFSRSEAVKFLFNYGGSMMINRADSNGNTGLHYLCTLCGQSFTPNQQKYDEDILSCMQFIIAHDADVNRKNMKGLTPMMLLLSADNSGEKENLREPSFLGMNSSCRSRALDLLKEYGAVKREYCETPV